MFIEVSKLDPCFEKVAIRVDTIQRVIEDSIHSIIVVKNPDGSIDNIECWESYSDIMELLKK